MKIRDLDIVKNISILFNKKIIVWGAGHDGQKVVELLDEMGLKICGVYDKHRSGGIKQARCIRD